MHLPPRQPAVTLTFDLQHQIRSLVETNEYYQSVLSKLWKAFLRYRGNNISPDVRTDGQTNAKDENIMPSLTLSSGERTLKRKLRVKMNK